MTSQLPDKDNNEPESAALKSALRRIFDSQIPNYGDYNLVLALSGHRDAADAPGSGSTAGYYVIGYRWQPTEIMVAPVDGRSFTGAGVPVELNMTNLSHAVRLPGGGYEVGTNTGRTFRFGVQPEVVLTPAPERKLRLHQSEDYADFTAFMEAFIARA